MTAAFSSANSGMNSEELAPSTPNTFAANSITAICKPRQTPKYGMLFSAAHLAAATIPSVPLDPNPPGTKIPLAQQTECHALWNLTLSTVCDSTSKSVDSTQTISNFLLHLMAACSKDLMTERYESFKWVYFPTKAMVTVSREWSTLEVNAVHFVNNNSPLDFISDEMEMSSNLNLFDKNFNIFCCFNNNGT